MAFEASKAESPESMLERVERSVGTLYHWKRPNGDTEVHPDDVDTEGKHFLERVSSGSGFFIEGGYFVTNKHCVRGSIFTVQIGNDKQLRAEVLYRDPVRDIAILKVEGESFEPLELGDSSTLRKGQNIWTMGTPHGMKGRVSAGVISGVPRSVEKSRAEDAEAGDPAKDEHLDRSEFIDTDADIHQGNSGGPFLDADGKVIGVATFMEKTFGGSLGFAIPINEIKVIAKNVQAFAQINTLLEVVEYQKHADDMRLSETFPLAVQWVQEVINSVPEEDRNGIMSDKGVRRMFQEMLTHPSTNREKYAGLYQSAFGVPLYNGKDTKLDFEEPEVESE